MESPSPKPFIDVFVGYLSDFTALDNNVNSLTEEMNTLKGIKADTMRAVVAAEMQGLTRTGRVKAWLENVQSLEDAASVIDTKFNKMFRCCFDCPLNVFSACTLSKDAKQKQADAQNLVSSGNFSVFADDQLPVAGQDMPSIQSVGQDSLLTEMHSFVFDTQVGIAGVYGMAGVGKTTLLNRFNNELRRRQHDFDLMIFVELSEMVRVDEIHKDIYRRLGFQWREDDKARERAIKILQALSSMKFLIIFDEVWDPVDLLTLGIPKPRIPCSSKIIVASRIEGVCARMDAKKMIKVECLAWSDAWGLFLEKAGEGLIVSHPEIRRYAEIMVRKCGGLPEAITTVGRAMATKRTPPDWRTAMTALYNSPADIQGMDRFLARLKRSYDKLPSDKLRLCFLYYLIYKEGNHISPTLPVSYWIGEGIIDGFNDVCGDYAEGHYIVHTLKEEGLLEDAGGGNVRMHGIMHSMAKWVASECGQKMNRWLVQPGQGLKEAPEVVRWIEAERISLMENCISRLPEELPDCPNLTSLMLQSNGLISAVPGRLLRSAAASLRVLDLSRTSIEELPAEIGGMVLLQFLDLSHTKLVTVPVELGKLGRLRYLDLSHIPTLRSFPEGVIEGLSSELQVLRMLESFGDWATGEASAGGGRARFEELMGLKRLKMLMITVETAEALQLLLQAHRMASSIHSLHIRAARGMTRITLPTDLGSDMIRLDQVCISHSDSLEEVVVDDERWCSYLPQVNFLRLKALSNAKVVFKLVPSGCTRSGLSIVEIIDCPKVEELIPGEVADEAAADGGRRILPALQTLNLIKLPELKSICRSALSFPSLRRMLVEDCPQLKRLPFGEQSCRSLEEIQGQQGWWDALVWDDNAAARARILPFFFGPVCRHCHCVHTHH